MTRLGFAHWLTLPIVAAGLLGACGGGSNDNSATGTLRLSLTDAPACGYDSVFVTVEKVRVHKSGSATDSDSGWAEVVLASPQRVDLLTLTNGTLLPLGQTALPAGTYTQMRLVLTPNGPRAPWPNAITPTGGSETALTTPSGQQSGLKANIDITVNPDTVADFAIDFDACKSFVRAGNSGQIILKPVLTVIPIVSTSITGWVDAALDMGKTSVSAQVAGMPVRATPPDAAGRFVLSPVPTGTYNIVITAPGRANAVMTGVPVAASGPTTIGSSLVRLVPPASAASAVASGTVSVNGSVLNTQAAVRALQVLTAGPTIEIGYAGADATTGAYSMTLPTAAPAQVAYAASAATFPFSAAPSDAGRYRLEASAPTFAVKTTDVTLPAAPVPFVFP